MRGIVIEGTSGVGKTVAMQRLRRWVVDTLPNTMELYIPERYTYQMLDRRTGRSDMSVAMVREHLDTVMQTVRPYAGMLDASDFDQSHMSRYCLAIIERTALTHCVYGDFSVEDFREHFEELGRLGIPIVVMTLDDKILEDRLRRASAERDSSDWKQHVAALDGVEKMVRFYIDWQRKLLECAKDAAKYVTVVYVDMSQPDNAVDELLRSCLQADK